jgi:phospholipid/cholesterol/gamma-HCH transport system ATP-binding protein
MYWSMKGAVTLLRIENDVDNVITIRDLHYSRGDNKILDGVSLDVKRGSITTVMGPSGTGKTTLLRLLGRELVADSGKIMVDGEDLLSLRRKHLYVLRKRMGIMFQLGGLFTDMDVFDNVAFPLREHTKLDERMIRDLVLLMLQAVGLRGAAHLNVEELSGGMARRIALARAVIMSPSIMFYDEPFTGQDPISRGVLIKLIKELNQALGMTTLIVSHNLKEVSLFSDYIILLFQGKVIASGSPAELQVSDNPAVKQFFQGQPDGPVTFHLPAKELREDLL